MARLFKVAKQMPIRNHLQMVARPVSYLSIVRSRVYDALESASIQGGRVDAAIITYQIWLPNALNRLHPGSLVC